jgi:hypothetical protein
MTPKRAYQISAWASGVGIFVAAIAFYAIWGALGLILMAGMVAVASQISL